MFQLPDWLSLFFGERSEDENLLNILTKKSFTSIDTFYVCTYYVQSEGYLYNVYTVF